MLSVRHVCGSGTHSSSAGAVSYCVCGTNYPDRWISDKESVKTRTVTLRQDTGRKENVMTEKYQK